jgi:hypothetical protein
MSAKPPHTTVSAVCSRSVVIEGLPCAFPPGQAIDGRLFAESMLCSRRITPVFG